MPKAGFSTRAPVIQSNGNRSTRLCWPDVLNSDKLVTLAPRGWSKRTGRSLLDAVRELSDVELSLSDSLDKLLPVVFSRYGVMTLCCIDGCVFVFYGDIGSTLNKLRTGFIILSKKWAVDAI